MTEPYRQSKRRHDEQAYGPREDVYLQIAEEVVRAKCHGIAFASLHEAYAVILEELDEIWDETRKKRFLRNELDLRKEFVQLAAMAVKAIDSMPNFTGGNV